MCEPVWCKLYKEVWGWLEINGESGKGFLRLINWVWKMKNFIRLKIFSTNSAWELGGTKLLRTGWIDGKPLELGQILRRSLESQPKSLILIQWEYGDMYNVAANVMMKVLRKVMFGSGRQWLASSGGTQVCSGLEHSRKEQNQKDQSYVVIKHNKEASADHVESSAW